jgi:hypothetical protein
MADARGLMPDVHGPKPRVRGRKPRLTAGCSVPVPLWMEKPLAGVWETVLTTTGRV